MAAQRASEGTSDDRLPPVLAAVLALVIERPSYAYELWKRFEARFEELHPLSKTRIYQVLDQLQRRGLIEDLPSEVPNLRQPRVEYRATAEGARAHREWLAATLRDDPRREELLRRLLATGARDARIMLQIVQIYERACLDDMARKGPRDTVAGGDLRDRLIAEERRLAHEARLRFIAFARRQLHAEIEGENLVDPR